MSEVKDFPIDSFLIEKADANHAPSTMSCIDDRPVKGLVWVMWQWGGGPDGLGRDYATAQEQMRPGSVIKEGRPIHRLALPMRNALAKIGVDAYMHWLCAAYGSAYEIDSLVANEPGRVYERAKQINSEMTLEQFEPVFEAKQRLIGTGLMWPKSDSDYDMCYYPGEKPFVPHLHLEDSPHLADQFIVGNSAGLFWDAKGAWENKTPAYFMGRAILGIVQPKLKEHLPPEIGSVHFDALRDASDVRHAAITLALEAATNVSFTFHEVKSD